MMSDAIFDRGFDHAPERVDFFDFVCGDGVRIIENFDDVEVDRIGNGGFADIDHVFDVSNVAE